MNVVIDTNVYIAAVMTGGHCERVVRHVWKHHHAVVSEAIIDECEKVLRKKLHITAQKTKKVCRLIRRYGQVVPSVPAPKKHITRDRMDDHVLSLAQYAPADVVITGDQDILILHQYHGIPLLPPKAYWSFEAQHRARREQN